MLTTNHLIGFGAEPGDKVLVVADFDEFMGQYPELPNVSDDNWASGWVWRPAFISIQGSESMVSYDAGPAIDTDLTGGLGWDGSWKTKSNYIAMLGFDDMFTYSVGTSGNNILNGGDPNGFSTGWIELDQYGTQRGRI